MSTTDHELWWMFRDEATEALEELAAVVDRMSAAEGGVAERDRTAAFRILHNIKGVARVVGSEGVEAVAHALEEALEARGSALDAAELAARLREGMGLVARFLGEGAPIEAARAFVQSASPAPHAPPAGEGAPPARQPGAPLDLPSGGDARGPGGAAVVRVEASRLDTLMQFAGDIMTAEARSHERHAELERCHSEISRLEHAAPGEIVQALGEIGRRLGNLVDAHRQDVQRFSHLSRDWSTAIKRTRLLPLAGAVPQWRRTIAETAHAIGREARLVADVGDIEIDRQILDGLRDPIMHLLRNAVDHGIEPPEERARLGKPRTGTIVVRAGAAGMLVELEVSDDGRGMDPEQIARRAVERGLAAPERLSQASAAEILDMVFLPGLSTTEHVNPVSGRGVGLDIVKQRLSELGGHARVGAPTLGGSTFRLEVPATVVSTKGLLVRSARAAFVLPMVYVVRTFRVPSTDVRVIDGMTAIEDALDEPLRLLWLSSLAGEPRRADRAKLAIVVISNRARRLGLVVEELVGEVEAVTRRLPWNVPRAPGIAGAMILGTGAVALVLDAPQLFGAELGRIGERKEGPGEGPSMRKRRVLVVDDSLTSRTLERNILVAAGYEVETANDGEAAWQALQAGAYDLVVTDVQMPPPDGVELTQRIRANARLRALPVVLVTSLDRPQDLARGTAAGADEYIVKGSFEERRLLEAVARLL
jgi:two-component system chemotaxis sensor kinase CheA